MITLLHTIDTTGPGGAETVFIDLATRLPKDRYRSVVVIRGHGWAYEELRRRGVQPVLLDASGSFNLRYLAGLTGLIRRERVDLIQSHLLGSNVYCSMAGMLTRRPVVATFHGAVDIKVDERFRALKTAAVNTGASSVIAVSRNLQSDILQRTGLKESKIKVIYNGIDIADYQRPFNDRLRQRYGWTEDQFVIGSLGNIRPAKGYQVLLRAAGLLSHSDRDYRFVIAGQGSGALYDELLQLRQNLGLEDKVIFAGYCDDAAEFISGIDLFLSSSISEGMPLSAIQGMVAGRPVLATRCGGYEELVSHAENGWLVETGNPQAIADAIEMLAGDPDLRARLALQGSSHAVANFDIDVMLDAYRKIYENLIGGKAALD